MNNLWKADLHSHTHCSDGTLSVEKTIDLAKSLKLSGLSITDHDTVEAYHTAPALAAEKNILLLGGVEFSTTFQGKSIHVLGYAFNLRAPEILALCQRHTDRRTNRNRVILQKLAQKGINITEEDLYATAKSFPKTSIGRAHIAQAMVKKGAVSTIKEAFHLYIGDNGPCYAQGEPITTQETLDILHRAGGVAVLAHPHLINDGKLVEAVLNLPFNGIEGYYAFFSADQNERWIKMAEKRKLLVVGGSDFHGDIKPNNSLGASWTPQETFNSLWELYLTNNPGLPTPAL